MHFCSTSTEPSREESPNTSAVVYEEIGDVMDSFKYTQNILYGVPTMGKGLTSSSVTERVKVQGSGEPQELSWGHDATANTDLPNVHEMYQINPAYGVNT